MRSNGQDRNPVAAYRTRKWERNGEENRELLRERAYQKRIELEYAKWQEAEREKEEKEIAILRITRRLLGE